MGISVIETGLLAPLWQPRCVFAPGGGTARLMSVRESDSNRIIRRKCLRVCLAFKNLTNNSFSQCKVIVGCSWIGGFKLSRPESWCAA